MDDGEDDDKEEAALARKNLFALLDVNNDKLISREEWEQAFAIMDEDGDGHISRKEWYRHQGTCYLFDTIPREELARINRQEWSAAFSTFDSNCDESIESLEIANVVEAASAASKLDEPVETAKVVVEATPVAAKRPSHVESPAPPETPTSRGSLTSASRGSLSSPEGKRLWGLSPSHKDLKEELERRGLKSSGKTAELQERLAVAVAQEEQASEKNSRDGKRRSVLPTSATELQAMFGHTGLKAELERRGLKSTGKTGDLAERLQQAILAEGG